ncbi:DUF1934 domain-containing protein [Acetonema longum]|uniref:DUF1934 domain-containing protein n=1 Tax=Acetonema longum DSM 6540 TaxID=1009370 RepID=F7NH98_9FIRM|nr:DUF1934 domain-containing protein [Acetonema longum]EGO64581.1 hypothetical protein ALO_07218 [Acetonema longum DSM 6540]
MNTVTIRVKGTQRDGTGEENAIELVTVGHSQVKNGVYYITYQEHVSGMEGSTTLLKIYSEPASLCLVRMGAFEQKQEFIPGEKTYCTYVTPYGSMKMAVATRLLRISRESTQTTEVEVQYDLEINGHWQSANSLLISVGDC